MKIIIVMIIFVFHSCSYTFLYTFMIILLKTTFHLKHVQKDLLKNKKKFKIFWKAPMKTINKFIPSSKNYIMKEAKYVKIQTEKFCCLYANVRQFSNTLIVPLFILKMLDW